MISLLMGERRQFENWGRPLGGTNFRGLRRWGQSPHSAYSSTHAQPIPHFTPFLFRISRIFYYPFHAIHVTHLTQPHEIRI